MIMLKLLAGWISQVETEEVNSLPFLLQSTPGFSSAWRTTHGYVYPNPGGTIRARDRPIDTSAYVYQTVNIRRLVYQKVMHPASRQVSLYTILFFIVNSPSILCAYLMYKYLVWYYGNNTPRLDPSRTLNFHGSWTHFPVRLPGCSKAPLEGARRVPSSPNEAPN